MLGLASDETGSGEASTMQADGAPAQAAERSVPEEEERTSSPRIVLYEKGKGEHAMDHYSVDGNPVGAIINQIFKKDIKEVPHHDLSCIWNLISNYARFDFEWRVSSPLSWNIEDNKVKRLLGPLDTNNTKYAAVTLNFDTEVVDQMEICLKLRTNAELSDGNAIFLGVLNDRTTDSFACIGKSGFITIRTTRNQQSNAQRWEPFNDGDIFGIRVKIPNQIQFCVNGKWSPVHMFAVGKLTTIYLSVRPILFEAEVVSLKMQQKKDFKLGKLPFRLRNVWPEGSDRD